MTHTQDSLMLRATRTLPKGEILPVSLLPKDLVFLSDSQDKEFISDYFGHVASGYDSFFVEYGNDGENPFLQVWGMFGIVPLLEKRVTKVF